jgi:hypothetical protein
MPPALPSRSFNGQPGVPLHRCPLRKLRGGIPATIDDRAILEEMQTALETIGYAKSRKT